VFWIIFFMFERGGVFTPDHVGIRSNPKVCYLYPSYGLSFQTETPEEKSSGLKKVGVMGLEFVGSFIITFPYLILAANESYKGGLHYAYYLAGMPLISTGSIWFIGWTFDEKGSVLKSLIGTGIGTSIGCIALWKTNEESYVNFRMMLSCILFAPFLGGVIGYNL